MIFDGNHSIGLDISDHKLRMVSVGQQYRRLILQHFATMDLTAGAMQNGTILNPNLLVAALRELPKHGFGVHWQNRSVHVGLPEQQTFITTIPFANGNKDLAEKELKRFLPFREDEMYYDVEMNRLAHTASVAASRKDIIQRYLEILKLAGYGVIGLHCETEAIAKALITDGAAKKTGIIIVDLGTARTTVVFSIQNAVHFTTSYPSVLTGNALQPDHLAGAVQQVKQYYEEHYATMAPLAEIMLCGSGAAIPNLVEWLQSVSGIQTVLGNPLKHFKTNRVVKHLQQPLTFTTAIGLALPK